MPKFLKSGKVVVLLSGRFAGKKAVIVKNFDDGTTSRPYGHALVMGLQKEPRKVIKRSSKKTQARRSTLKTFIKTINYNHIMPTRYTLDIDFKGLIAPEVAESGTKKTEARKECKKVLEEKFKTGKNRWFFTKLRF